MHPYYRMSLERIMSSQILPGPVFLYAPLDAFLLGLAPMGSLQGFVVKHYAGLVEYNTKGWLDKKLDRGGVPKAT